MAGQITATYRPLHLSQNQPGQHNTLRCAKGDIEVAKRGPGADILGTIVPAPLNLQTLCLVGAVRLPDVYLATTRKYCSLKLSRRWVVTGPTKSTVGAPQPCINTPEPPNCSVICM